MILRFSALVAFWRVRVVIAPERELAVFLLKAISYPTFVIFACLLYESSLFSSVRPMVAFAA